MRGGYVFGNALLLATVGWAGTNWQENDRGKVATPGSSYGIGLDYKVWKGLFVSVEYVHRDVTSDLFPWRTMSEEYFDSSLESFEIRLGWNF